MFFVSTHLVDQVVAPTDTPRQLGAINGSVPKRRLPIEPPENRELTVVNR
jgi:hypothetical protein